MKGKNYITAEIETRAKEISETVSIGAYTLGADVSDRKVWERAARHTGAPALLQKAETILQEEIAVIDDALYYSAGTTGTQWENQPCAICSSAESGGYAFGGMYGESRKISAQNRSIY